MKKHNLLNYLKKKPIKYFHVYEHTDVDLISYAIELQSGYCETIDITKRTYNALLQEDRLKLLNKIATNTFIKKTYKVIL